MADALIVDESTICRELLCRSLEVHGYVAVPAAAECDPGLSQAQPALVIIDPGAESPLAGNS